MSIDTKVIELEARAQRLAKHYHKGFVGILSRMAVRVGDYVQNPDESIINEVEIIYSLLRNPYESIPFSELKDEEVFYPLFITKRLLLKLEEQIQEAFKTKREDWAARVNETATAIAAVGMLYEQSLMLMIYELRQYPGHERFSVKVRDYDGVEWHLPKER